MPVKKVLITLLLIFPFFQIHGQLLGLGGQYAHNSNGQFFINAAFPTYTKGNAFHIFNLSGLDYTTSGGARLSGLQLKPIQLASYLSDYIFYESPIVLSLGVDAGYLFDFRKNHKNTIVLTPNFYMDYKIFFLKTGYEVDTFHGNNQFFVRAGIGFALGTIKNFKAR